jgi:hypothetical protein
MKSVKLRIEDLESRSLAGGFWNPLDRDHFLVPPVQIRRTASVWLDDLTVSYDNGPLGPTYDDTHRVAFASHLERTADLLANGTATAYGFLTDKTEFDYASKPLAPTGVVELGGTNANALQKTGHPFFYRLTIDGKDNASASLSPMTPTLNNLLLDAPVDGNGQKYDGDGTYVQVTSEDDWNVRSAVAYANGYANDPVSFKLYLQNSKDKSWKDVTPGKIEAPVASAGLRRAAFTVTDHSWCYPTAQSYYCQLKWTETQRAGGRVVTFLVQAYVPISV